MTSTFDRIIIAVQDLDDAIAQYQQLLGASAHPAGTASGGRAAWLALPNTVIELVQRAVECAVITGIAFGNASSGAVDVPLANSRELELYLCDGSATADFRRRHPAAAPPLLRVDHLVLRTADADGCIELFANQLGLRLALDRTVPEWGGRMLFFRAGKLTLEIIEAVAGHEGDDFFWGIAYQCQDIEQTVQELSAAGLELSGIRQGRKPGTRVATLKSHCLGIPTLLIEPAK